jgi:hypothetical protein
MHIRMQFGSLKVHYALETNKKIFYMSFVTFKMVLGHIMCLLPKTNGTGFGYICHKKYKM